MRTLKAFGLEHGEFTGNIYIYECLSVANCTHPVLTTKHISSNIQQALQWLLDNNYIERTTEDEQIHSNI